MLWLVSGIGGELSSSTNRQINRFFVWFDALVNAVRANEDKEFKEFLPEEETFDELVPSDETKKYLGRIIKIYKCRNLWKN